VRLDAYGCLFREWVAAIMDMDYIGTLHQLLPQEPDSPGVAGLSNPAKLEQRQYQPLITERYLTDWQRDKKTVSWRLVFPSVL
jgi:hypothetical protein